jgi:AhpD family alkylhydroperoxidase
MRELIAPAVAISLRCDGCITVRANAAHKLGVTQEDLPEALGVAVSFNADATIICPSRGHDAVQALQET